ncbi:MAG: glycosyltransferase family 39 protein [Patescibacteria group bacterium]|nr:glycosyltransferase family 39 protein [Patescibacteria group bacterium]
MKKYWPLVLVLIGGALLRFYHNLDISLWHDEAFSALLIKYSWPEMMYRIGLDVHPPMYYIFLRFWHYLFGDSLLSLRGFSVFFGTATIWAGWLFTKEAFKNEKAALWAAILLAVNPFQLRFVTEARMYTMGAFFALLAAYFLVKALELQKRLHEAEAMHMPHLPEDIRDRNRLIFNYVGFIASTIIIIYTHYYLFFTAAALGFYGLLYLYFHHKWDAKKYLWYLVSWAIIAASFLPWLKTFLFQYRQVDNGYWIPPMDRWSIPATFWDMLLGLGRDTTKASTDLWLIVITLLTLYIFYRFLRKTESFHKWLAVLAVAAPFLGSLLFLVLARLKGSSSSVFLDRYFLFASVFYSIAVAVWLKEIRFRALAASIFALYCLLNLYTFWYAWQDLNIMSKPGMAAAARFLSMNVEPGQKVFVSSSFMFFNFQYYWTEAGRMLYPPALMSRGGEDGFSLVRPLLYTGGTTDVHQMPHYAGTAILTDQDLLPTFSGAVATGNTVWLLWTDVFGSTKPEVPKNWLQVDERAYPEVRPYVGTNIFVTEYKVN